MKIRHTIAIAAVAALAGCVGTTPPRLYTLNMTPSGTASAGVNIEVARLRPLDAISGADIVVRRSEHELDTYPLHHWASNIGELTAKKLSAEFGDVAPDLSTLSVTGDILEFEQADSGAGTAEARAAFALEFRKKGESRYTDPLLAKTYRARSPINGAVAPANVVAALSRAVETIAREISEDVHGLELTAAPVSAKRETLHTLNMAPGGRAAASLNIDVTSLRRSEALARNSILIRTNPTRIEYYAQDRWAASVSTLVAEKLESEFGAPETGRETVRLTGTILAFERLDTPEGTMGHVKLDATLEGSTQDEKLPPLLWKLYEASAPAAGDSAEDVVQSLSRALEDVAVSIAVDAGRIPPAPTSPGAPTVNLYTIDMTPSETTQCDYNVAIGRIQPHDSLTRADILIVRDETMVDRYPHDRWASGLAELVPEKLGAEFGHPVDGRKTVEISGTIGGFEQIERKGNGPAAHVKLNLEFRWAGATLDAPAFRRTYETTVPLDGQGAHAAVKALSRGIEQIAEKVAADINAMEAP